MTKRQVGAPRRAVDAADPGLYAIIRRRSGGGAARRAEKNNVKEPGREGGRMGEGGMERVDCGKINVEKEGKEEG